MWQINDIVDETYQIVRELGSGGTGVIYLAYHLRLQKYVVLKLIKSTVSDVLKVRTEVDILKKLHHTYLPQVYDFMQYGNRIYTVIDYIDGCDLQQYINAGYIFSEERLTIWLEQLCTVLDYLHKQKPSILHCDIKPGNIMIDTEDNVCLIDFNVSLSDDNEKKLTGISQYYASPEQYQKAISIINNQNSDIVITPGTDIYSLGATFYHMICGQYPSSSQKNIPLTQMSLNYSYEFLAVIDRMMEWDVHRRYKRTTDVLYALERMRRKDSGIRKLIGGITISSIIYALIITCGIISYTYGNEINNIDSFTKRSNTFIQYVDAGDYTEALKIGVDVLNESKYTGYYNKHPEQKSIILHGIGDCYYYSGEYDEAAKIYEKSIDFVDNDKSGDYYRDYVIALVRSDRINDALELIEKAKQKGISNDNLSLIHAEILLGENKYTESLEVIETLIDSDDNNISLKAVNLGGEVSGELSDYEKQIDYQKKALKLSDTIQQYRMLGDAYIRYAQSINQNHTSEHDYCYKEAKKCYDKLMDSEYTTFDDSMNMAVILMELKQYNDAEKQLLILKQENKDDYRIYMYLAFIYEKEKDYSSALNYCKTAIQLYENESDEKRESRLDNNIQNLYSLSEMLNRS